MSLTREAAKRRLNLTDEIFSTEELYKEARKAAETLGFSFVEKEHSIKPDKYGDERKYVFLMGRRFDAFAKTEIEIELKFENLNKVKKDGKTLERGDGEIVLTANVVLDYKNEWWMRKLHRSLLEFYLKYFVRDRVNRLYFGPAKNQADTIYTALKNKLDAY